MADMIDVIRGSDVKFNLYVAPIDGITLETYDFHIDAYCAGTSQHIKLLKSECTHVDDSNYTVPIETVGLATGQLILDVYANIPDNDFNDGFRTEIIRRFTNINVIQ